MSYVLEALKKAEAQKDPGARTALVQERREYRRNRWWQILVASALLANLFVLLWLFYPRSETGAPADPVPAQQPALAESSPQTQVTPAQSFQQPQALQQPQVLQQSLAETLPVTGSGAATPAAPPVRVHLSDLPPAPRSRFPGLAFSTHIYAEDPALRALVVNGNRLTEGDRFGVLVLVEVTEEGAVFGFENFLVDVSVLDTWD